MKRKLLTVAFIALGASVFAQQLTVAVSPFQERSGFTKDEADIVTELFTAQLVSSGAAIVVDRNSFDQILAEMRFQISDWSDNNKVARLGAALNADSIITGQLMRLGNQTIITANLLDIRTAQIVSSSRMQLNSLEQVFDKMPAFVEEMAGSFPQPNYLTGRWRVPDTNMALDFRPDGTFILNNYIVTYTTYYDPKNRSLWIRQIDTGTISGTYTYTKNTVRFAYEARTAVISVDASRWDRSTRNTRDSWMNRDTSGEGHQEVQYFVRDNGRTLQLGNIFKASMTDGSSSYYTNFIK